jgi:hypothetical protein
VKESLPKRDSRIGFYVLDLESAEDSAYSARLGKAADRTAKSVANETAALFRKYGVPMPSNFAQDRFIKGV